MAEFKVPKKLHMNYDALTPEVKTQLQALADEIGVPAGYITIGYATYFSYSNGSEDKAFDNIADYRNSLLRSVDSTLGAKPIIITSLKINLPDGTDFTSKEYDKYEKIVKKWAKKAR